MVMDGLVVLLCAGSLLLADPPSTGDRERQVTATLAVQTALEQGRALLLKGEYRAAVYVLEGQIAHINGNRVYLRTLQDAYRGHVKELRLTKQDAAAETYLQRLRILDPGAGLEEEPRGDAASRLATTAPASRVPPTPRPAAVDAATGPGKSTIRMQAAEEARPTAASRPAAPESPARDWLARAEQEFSQRRYQEASRLYEQAHQADRNLAAPARSRWAYCKLHAVVEQLNRTGIQPPAWDTLEREAQTALALAPQLDFGKQVLAEISKRKTGADTWQDLPVQHHAQATNGWQVAESTSFRIYHSQKADFAAQAARAAEKARAEMQLRWLGGTEKDWTPKCDIILYATADDYHRATGLPTQSPGHSKLALDGGRLVGRQVHLRCDHANAVTAILPHEVTHVVLASAFTEVAIPRWADEGIAVLAEPREQVERHLRNLPQYHRDGQLFGLRELMEQSYQPQQEKYPEPRRIGVFYAQSISLVEFLSNLNGPQTFTTFLREGGRQGYESALQRHYGISNYQELQQRWVQHAFGTTAATRSAP